MEYQPSGYAATQRGNIEDLEIHRKDREALRKLAAEVAEIASRPQQKEKRDLWFRHNDLEATRPVILCDPENGWNEIIPQGMLECEGESARKWEFILRKQIFWGEFMGDDYVVEPNFNIPYTYSESDIGMHAVKHQVGGSGSYSWEAPLKDYKDLGQLHFPEIKVDYEKTENVLCLAKEIFGEFLNVQLKGKWWISLGMTAALSELRGLEQMMLDMYDYPDELHQLMGFLRDSLLARIDFVEKNGLLSLNHDSIYAGGGVYGYTHDLPQRDFDGKVRAADTWGWFESQETSEVSPEMFGEFVFPYQLPLMERFGLVSYGCCEAMNGRWHIVSRIPRLRRVSVSPWANVEDMADKLGDKYVYAMKPTPADLALPRIDEGYLRNKLREAIRATKNCRVEIIMKDNHTIGCNPLNVIRWCKIAMEEAQRI